jgi:branched-chain amino acid transport system ATP-binding protein
VPDVESGQIVLEARHITSGYGELAAVRDIDMKLRAGEVVSLIGPNGAGKTTLMLALIGELPLMKGEVRWRGAATKLPLHRRVRNGLGFVPEGRSIVKGLSVADNLRLAPGGIDPALAVFPELKPLLTRPAGLLSGGEQQMVALGRALACSPRALLVDEFSLGLAPVVVQRLTAAVTDAARRLGLAVLLVEQQIVRAFVMCDRWIVMKGGVVMGSGNRAETTMEDVERAYLSEVGAAAPSPPR